ncbi:ankyrin repeat and SOCS box protein 13 [Spea bombifrons]|uniref:ankyrin repeat and SOCS box protein 13 n=1 Tax=Spea bombifrons TaxID=233779 RepID=UPI0023495854|nr:ankyrin repeat and SOCS box protein 13 [Spea bombifrons]
MEIGDPPITTTSALRGPVIGDIGNWVDRTPIHDASRHGHTLQLKQLIETGVCVNLVTVDSITPLHEACLQGHIQCVKLLLGAGAQVDARNVDGSTPLCDASASGSLECMKLLLDYGAKVNPPLFTASPLHEACMNGNPECVKFLIEAGANLEAHDCHFGTALHVACAREHLDCAKALLCAGANVNAAKLHETALHHAAKVKNKDLIEMLVDFGGNVYARDNRGKRPSDYTWPNSPTAKCFEYYERMPRTLAQLCRITVRKALGQKAIENASKLNIPPRLIEYISYK